MKVGRVGLVVGFLALVLSCVLLASPALAVTQAEINDSIDDGVAWLVPRQDVSGAWVGDGFTTANTGFVLAVLEHDAEKRGLSPLDPAYAHSTNVQNGLNYLFNNPYLVYDS